MIYIGNETALKGIIVGMLSTNLNVNRCYRLHPLGKSCTHTGNRVGHKRSYVHTGRYRPLRQPPKTA